MKKAKREEGKTKQFLIVEDGTTMSRMLANILLAGGYSATSVYTATEAQHCFQSTL